MLNYSLATFINLQGLQSHVIFSKSDCPLSADCNIVLVIVDRHWENTVKLDVHSNVYTVYQIWLNIGVTYTNVVPIDSYMHAFYFFDKIIKTFWNVA